MENICYWSEAYKNDETVVIYSIVVIYLDNCIRLVLLNMDMNEKQCLAGMGFIIVLCFFGAGRDIGFFMVGATIFYIAAKYRPHQKASFFLPFFLGLVFLYPTIFSGGLDFHDKGFVIGIFSIAFYLLNRRKVDLELRKRPVIKAVVVFWLFWSVLSYIPVLVSSLGIQFPPFDLIYSENLAEETTLIKTTVRQFSVILILLPVLTLRTVSDFRVFFKVVGILAAVVVLAGFAQYFTGFKLIPENYDASPGRFVTFSMPDPNGYARLMVLPIFVLFSQILAKRKVAPHILMLFACILVSIVLSFSRTAYISLFLGLFFVGASYLRYNRSIKPIIVFLSLSCFMLPTLMAFEEYYEQNYNRLGSSGNVIGRINYFRGSVEIIRKNILFGVHPGQYRKAMSETEVFKEWRHPVSSSTHNIYTQTAVDWGAPLGAALLMCFGLSVKYVLQSKRLLKKRQSGDRLRDDKLSTIVYSVFGVTICYGFWFIAEIVPTHFIFFLLGLAISTRDLIRSQLDGTGVNRFIERERLRLGDGCGHLNHNQINVRS